MTNVSAAHHLLSVRRRPSEVELPDWVGDLPAVRQLFDGWEVPAGVTVLIGENGAGKSTVVEALAQRYPRLGGGDRTGPTQVGDESSLASHLYLRTDPMASRAGFFLRAETMHDYLRERDRAAGKTERAWSTTPLLARSHGEGFLFLLQEAFWEPGMYFLDEPEAALSFTSCLALVAQLARMPAEGSQAIVATHSPLIAATPGATVIEIGADGMVETDWRDTDLVRHWQSFLSDPDRFLRHL